ncbi:substrate-binding periplasmic protein [Neptuniibacter sp. QD37_6]|uniref:substrate-binding periplasmic protein n=1 Tax=Neptuniibacter sp. QD37_6 TaxID=3398210 RepID=UPI0039F4D7B5
MKSVKFYFKFCFISLMAVISASLHAEECKVLTATGNSEYPPYLWRADDGTTDLLGANRLIIDELGKRLGVDIQLQDVGSWARAQDMLRSGRIDLMAGAFYTIPRNQYMDYVYPAFLNTKSVVWRRKGSGLVYDKREDLIGRLGVTVINNSFGQEFDEYAKANLNLQYVASLKQAFLMIQRSRADYALYEQNPGLAYADLLGYKSDLEVLDPAISSEGLYLTVSHKSKCNTGALRGMLAKAIRDMEIDGFMANALTVSLKNWNEFSAK